jgi:acyl-coenzyme A synthetase/AMP-(fatty) acid ligase
MSEISTYVSSGPQVPTRPGSPGRPQAGRKIAILDPHGDDTAQPVGTIGLLAVHRADPGLMLGYWNRPDDTAAAFRGAWFLTGDCARLDADGYVWYEGRADDQMNASGYRVAPQEVEAVLLEHNAIADCAVTETRQGEVSLITAFVVLKGEADGTPATADDILAHAQARLAAYKAPRRIVFADDLPRTPTGKLKRRDLRG